MATPERRTESTDLSVPGPIETAHQVADTPLEQSRDIGWIVTMLGAAGALLASWTLFSTDQTNGMWAGYWTTLFCTIAIIGAAALRSSLAATPAVVVTTLCGIGMILVGALHDYDTEIKLPMVAGGAVIALGAIMQAGKR